jgi:hypothetical protein
MGRKALLYSAGLIALYIAVAYGTNFGQDITATTNGGANLVRVFQGR